MHYIVEIPLAFYLCTADYPSRNIMFYNCFGFIYYRINNIVNCVNLSITNRPKKHFSNIRVNFHRHHDIFVISNNIGCRNGCHRINKHTQCQVSIHSCICLTFEIVTKHNIMNFHDSEIVGSVYTIEIHLMMVLKVIITYLSDNIN